MAVAHGHADPGAPMPSPGGRMAASRGGPVASHTGGTERIVSRPTEVLTARFPPASASDHAPMDATSGMVRIAFGMGPGAGKHPTDQRPK